MLHTVRQLTDGKIFIMKIVLIFIPCKYANMKRFRDKKTKSEIVKIIMIE